MAEEKYDREEEIKQGYPNAIEVKSTVKEAGEAVRILRRSSFLRFSSHLPGGKSDDLSFPF